MSGIQKESVIMAEWHLDKKVTLSIILALLLNAGSSIWWAARLDNTVANQDLKIKQNAQDIRMSMDRQNQILERLAGIEANQRFQVEALKEIRERVK